MAPKSLPLVFCALDTREADHAAALAAAMDRADCGVKVGLELFNACGPRRIQEICEAYPDLELFLDLKFHDIPNTVAGAVRAIAMIKPAYINVHATGGAEMMRAAKEAAMDEADKVGIQPPRVLGVTLLTSLRESDMDVIGFKGSVSEQVAHLARLAQEAGLDGVVCSAHEIETVRRTCGEDFILMVPGIRPAGEKLEGDDQRRVMTPAQAIQAGATHLVIGRPITRADDPEAAAAGIMREIAGQENLPRVARA